mmetsp:Transcript_6367/g.14131  ORF Transcript_6367/g.14131 Transcript_6367/m.14131 type:complete len:224 (+) Transcript_6367:65-736(+)|eukprot:CAMPEP_0202891782 /NCGR_PEP_ID=MMETSP1392-20130828/1755_1 /ASSEMBLY_ACC=CAM_ASM_000868 /TAXON_ID=225041 /ORGANISM="Chlamydomonas chlamydogama, Strain SAG 11-48b" /LENGTH=223 /DNA_ID=CAMNT_0049575635 /DNA_START=65 /DNA_END=736 /DNA_ORIENTATION=+
MATGLVSLKDPQYFPRFCELPQSDDISASYYSENAQGLLLPSRTWCFVAEIVGDTLSQQAVLGHRVEVKDMNGEVHSVLFYPEPHTPAAAFNYSDLQAGSTLFIRYAQRCFFSDLATEAIKVEDMSFVKTIPINLDSLLFISATYFEAGAGGGPLPCAHCWSDTRPLGGSAPRCGQCSCVAYCSEGCRQANAPHHATFCALCSELASVFNVDLERFTSYIPFR